MSDAVIERGTVSSYDTFKGFGFIRRDKGRDVFFFYDDVTETEGLIVGDVVRFEVKIAPKGPRAYKVSKLTDD
ncbi:cold-shock protein [Pseudomonas monteilii]|jgi:CspA family cold shock protein|uniref:retron Se72 family effector protein n=1 Tax=Pseudomonas TaxID=286 RepID=UPI000CD3B354|nr:MULTISPECIES: retron Se72 family effector protein [Pseudomonas]AYN17968.1 cold-shock protein [Pseudomonas monteilii]AYN98320.1 cold shock domain-containing protein [Pseudomonas sp. LTGT-11-2Z]MCE0875843.1 retron Se72 family effector protein [Pseudomonas monteilii]MCE0928662.1 retron Se72 family effector protein [Pseudomonas monteilii]MCE0934184.1 retron Se72 family effector protein [Pseudomonas monteilii]